MVKTAQSVAHRLKEDEAGEGSGRDGRPQERNHIGIQDVGVKVCSGAMSRLYTPLWRAPPLKGELRSQLVLPRWESRSAL